MARRARGDEPGSWHHVVNRAIAKRPYFERRSDQRYFLSGIGREVRAGRIEVHAYCLMTTHFHLLVRSPVGELSEAMRRIQYRYSRYFNRLRRRDGPLIRGRFFSKCVKTDLYRRTLVRYIDLNPVRARVVPASEAYEFGSARAYVGESAPPWLSRGWVEARALELTGEARFSAGSYARAFGPHAAEDMESIRSFVDERMGSAAELDPLDDLVGANPDDVRDWMRRKALLADGHEVGLPICGLFGLLRAIEAEVEGSGEWLVDHRGRTWRGSELTRVGLLRHLCAASWTTIAASGDWTVDLARRRYVEHRRAMREDTQYADRVERVASSALQRTLPLGEPT